jgi:hypothetical protein
MGFLDRLVDRFRRERRRRGSGVRPSGRESLLVAIGPRTFWVQARREAPTAEYVVWASDVRDITDAATVISAPPAAPATVPEVRRRLEEYFAASGLGARYL